MICPPVSLFAYAAIGFVLGLVVSAAIFTYLTDVWTKLAVTRLEIIGALVEAYDHAASDGTDKSASELEQCMNSARRIARASRKIEAR